jgi:hypothetical protein
MTTMRFSSLGFGLLLFSVLSASALADSQTADQQVTATKLMEYCQLSATEGNDYAEVAFCYGYIDAGLDYHATLTAGSGTGSVHITIMLLCLIAGNVLAKDNVDFDKSVDFTSFMLKPGYRLSEELSTDTCDA